MASDAERAADETVEGLPSRRWWALTVIAIAQLMVVLDGTVAVYGSSAPVGESPESGDGTSPAFGEGSQ